MSQLRLFCTIIANTNSLYSLLRMIDNLFSLDIDALTASLQVGLAMSGKVFLN